MSKEVSMFKFITKIVDWFKAPAKIKLIKDIVASAADGKLSALEMATLIEDIKALIENK